MPFTLRLNFHPDLDFFLDRSFRNGPVLRQLSERTSVKDIIESCGVPHTEVDAIVLNNGAVGFEFVIETGATVEVYSVNSANPGNAGARLQSRDLHQFVADGHLGGLVHDLRLLGFDVAYDPNAEDRQLLEIMTRENRALLTRDRRLLMHKIVRHGYCPRSQDSTEQVVEVIRRFELAAQLAPFTRCAHCNSLLRPVEKREILEQLEPLTRLHYDEFRKCTGCEQIYWRGSHFDKLARRVEELRARLNVQ